MSVYLRCCAVLAIASAAAAGCTTTVTSQPEPGDAARRAANLNALLLTPDDIDTAMNSTGMTVDTTTSTLVDDSPYTKPAECLAVSSIGQEHVYADSNWRAVRMQSLHEPGQDYSHLAHQGVVEFPTEADAAAFTRSRSARGGPAPRPATPTAPAPASKTSHGTSARPTTTPGC